MGKVYRLTQEAIMGHRHKRKRYREQPRHWLYVRWWRLIESLAGRDNCTFNMASIMD